MDFLETTYLREILDHSRQEKVVIFKYSNSCGSSERLRENMRKIETSIPVYLVTVQTHKALSEKIADWFQIKHESPQIFVIHEEKVTYTAHHNHINLEKVFE